MSLEILNNKNSELFNSKILSIDKLNGNLENIKGIKSFNEISYETKFGESQKCITTKGDFYSSNMDLNTLFNDISNRSNEKFFFYYQKYALENPSVDLGISPTTLGTITTSYIPPKYYDYQLGTEKKRAQVIVELNRRACNIDLKSIGAEYILNPENQEISFSLKYIYTDYLDKRNFDNNGEFTIDKEYNAIIVKTSDPNAFLSITDKLSFKAQVLNKIISLFTKKLQESTEGKTLKFLYEKMPDIVAKEILNRLFQEMGISMTKSKDGENEVNNPVENLLWKHIEILSNYDDKGVFSWTKDSSGALINLFKVFKDGQFLFQSFQKNQTLIKRIFNNMNRASFVNGRETSNKTVFANFINALCIHNKFNGLRILAKEFIIGKDYAISSGRIFQKEKDNEFFLQQLKKKIEKKTIYTPAIVPGNPGTSDEVTSYELTEDDNGNLYHPMDIVRIKYSDKNDGSFTLVSAMTIKAFAEERDQQLREDAIRIGFDALGIILGIVFFPAGGVIAVTSTVLGIGLAAIDIGFITNRENILLEHGGKEFLESWDKIYFVGGIALASITIIEQVFAKSVFSYLNAIKNKSPLLEVYEKSLGQILLEREILTFAGNTLKANTEISVKILAYNSKEISKATGNIFDSSKNLLPLYEKGAILVEVGEKEYALVYKGEKLIQGNYSNEKYVKNFYKEIKKIYQNPTELTKTLTNLWEAKSYQLIEILDHRGSPIGEFDEVFHNKRIFVEDKSAQGLLQNINPKTGKPWQTFESWASKQIFEKTYNRIKALEVAKSTRARLPDGLTPDVAAIRGIRKLEFQILETDIEIQKAVNNEMQRLKKEFPHWEFTAKFGK
ncbi:MULTISPECIES: hypothetical protein [unclassified Chryseobacterium]|uniref:hypothetical protein n=1 Tax=unclassified Chryseobacterium TaxID=2593645 RepID=UPI00226AE134|nr:MULTISPECIES: hypothetical protein [unclassified Chryseobacterium]